MEKIYLAGQVPVPEGIQLILGHSKPSFGSKIGAPRSTALQKSAEDVDTVIKQEWKNGVWVNKTKTITLWDNPWLPKEFITSTELQWVDSDWVAFQRYRSDYSSGGLNYTMFFESWEEGSWWPKEKISYEYENGLLIRQLFQVSSDRGSTWRDEEKTENCYDANGFRKSCSHFMWNGSALEKMEMTVFKNNERGLPVEERYYQVCDSAYNTCPWDTFFTDMRTFKYHEIFPFSVLEKTYLWDETSSREKILYTYQEQAYWLIEILAKSKSATNTSDTTWYDKNRTTQRYTTKSFNNTTINYMSELIQQVCLDGVWINTARTTTTVIDVNPNYNSETISQIWSDGWQNSERQLYSYKMAGTSLVADRILAAPKSFSLSNYPNPFNPSTTLSFTLPETDAITLRIFDVRGQWVATLLKDTRFPAGKHQQIWDGTNWQHQAVPTGVYFFQIENYAFRNTSWGLLVK